MIRNILSLRKDWQGTWEIHLVFKAFETALFPVSISPILHHRASADFSPVARFRMSAHVPSIVVVRMCAKDRIAISDDPAGLTHVVEPGTLLVNALRVPDRKVASW